MPRWDWKRFAKDVADAILDHYDMIPERISAQDGPRRYEIMTEWGWDYYEEPEWDDRALQRIVSGVADRYGLTKLHPYEWDTPDGKPVEVTIMANTNRPGRLHLAAIADELDRIAGNLQGRTAKRPTWRPTRNKLKHVQELVEMALNDDARHFKMEPMKPGQSKVWGDDPTVLVWRATCRDSFNRRAEFEYNPDEDLLGDPDTGYAVRL